MIRLLRDNRGGVSMLFGAAAVAFLGLVGLAIEAGSWYQANRSGQNAADAAAIAGAQTLALSNYQKSSAETAVYNTATKNGYTSGGDVTVEGHNPPSEGTHTGSNLAVEAIVNQTKAGTFSGVLGLSSTYIKNRAVAMLQGSGTACVLSLSQTLTIQGSITMNSSNCTLASNKQGADSININGGSASGTAYSLTSVGACTDCPGGLTLTSPPSPYSIPSYNPFSALDSQTWPTFDSSECIAPPNITLTGAAELHPSFVSAGGTAAGATVGFPKRFYCGSLTINAGANVDFQPGIYIFKDAPISINGGIVRCSKCSDANGVHIVQIDTTNGAGVNGGQPVNLTISGNATVTLNAGSVVPSVTGAIPNPPSLTGVLYYRMGPAPGGGNPSADITGSSGSSMRGGFYVPNGLTRYSGTSGSSCTIVVGAQVTIQGDTALRHAGCANIGTPLSIQRMVVLVE